LRATLNLGAIAAALAVAGCGSTADTDTAAATSAPRITAPAPLSQAPTQVPTTQALAPTTQAPAPASAAPVETVVLMPSVVCMNLQDAQNSIQAAGVFFSRSTDATGAGRAQVMDRNWIVVGQEPAPGTPIGEGEAVLSVVKLDEPNAC
jgi:hypothetical protein